MELSGCNRVVANQDEGLRVVDRELHPHGDCAGGDGDLGVPVSIAETTISYQISDNFIFGQD